MIPLASFRNRSVLFAVVLLLLMRSLPVRSQVTARGMAMGGAYTALARGVHAADWNPANLGMPDNPAFSISIIGVGVQVSNNSFTKSMYDKYSQKEYWDSSDKADILSSIPDNGLRAGLRGTFRFLSFSAGKFALTLGAEAGGFANIEKSIFDILLYGNEIGRTYHFDHFGAGSEAVGQLGLSYGDQIHVDFARTFTIGGTLNILYGIQYAGLEKANVRLVSEEFHFDMAGDFEGKTALGETGWSLTLGSTAQIDNQWTLSLCLKNIIGKMSWTKDVKQEIGQFGGNKLSFSSLDDDEAFQDTSWTIEGNSFSSRPPVQLNIGSLYREGDILLAADYVQGFQKTAWTTTTPQISIGTEWQHISWLPLRMGVLIGGRFGLGSSAGFGLRAGSFAWDVAIMNRGFITSGSSKGLVLATEFGLWF
jgi:hypothetical protein